MIYGLISNVNGMSKSSVCKCGHFKSDHANVKCEWLMCPCLRFEIKVKSQEKIDSKIDRESKIEFGINAEIFQEFHGAEKRKKKRVKRSERYDDVEQHWTKIADAEGRDYDLRISEATEILKKDFTNVDAWIEKGMNLWRSNKAAEALPCFDNALLLDKKNTSALLYQGYSYEDLDTDTYSRKAIKCFEDALNIDEENIDVLNEIAYVHQRFSEYDDSLRYLGKALKIDERNSRALDNMGFCYKQLKKYSMALDCLTKSNKLEERTGDKDFAAREIVDIHWLNDDNEKALEMADQLIKDEKANYRIYYIKGRIFEDKEKNEEAIKFFKKSLRLRDNVDSLIGLGMCYYNIRRYDLAILYYEKGLDRKKLEREIALTNLGACYYEIKEYKTALNKFEEALEINPKYVRAVEWKLDVYDKLKRWDETLVYVDEHPEFQNELVIMKCKRMALFQLKKYPDALKCSTEMLKIKKTSNFLRLAWLDISKIRQL